eukprot:5802789-Amphidinium_carterae.1
MFKIELMGVPELRPVLQAVQQAVLSKHGALSKQGVAPRNPPVRAVLKTLVDLGEWDENEPAAMEA